MGGIFIPHVSQYSPAGQGFETEVAGQSQRSSPDPDRQGHDKGAPLSWGTFDLNTATQCFDQVLGDCQAQSRTAVLFGFPRST